MVAVQKFCLQPGHVDLGRTFRLAGLAAQAQIKRFVEFIAAHRAGAEAAANGCPERVGPAADGMALVAGGHERGAHRSRAKLATVAVPVAHLHQPGETSIGREVKRRIYRSLGKAIVGVETQ